MFISLESVVEAARRRLAALTPEVAGYVVLLAARQLESRPSRVSLGSLLLTDAGEVQLRPEPEASERDTEADLRATLATLLELSPSPVPAITAVTETRASDGLAAFIDELSAALIPINHAAAHRSLARLYRETIRAGISDEAPPVRAEEPRAVEQSGVLELPPELSSPDVEASVELTAAPPPVMPSSSSEHPLEIAVDVEAEPELESAFDARDRVPPVEPRVAAATSTANDSLHGGDQQSDVRELLLEFLSDARCDERMARVLRAMIGLEPSAAPTNRSDPEAPPTSVSR